MYRLMLMYYEDLDFDYIQNRFQHPKEELEFKRWLEEASLDKDEYEE